MSIFAKNIPLKITPTESFWYDKHTAPLAEEIKSLQTFNTYHQTDKMIHIQKNVIYVKNFQFCISLQQKFNTGCLENNKKDIAQSYDSYSQDCFAVHIQ